MPSERQLESDDDDDVRKSRTSSVAAAEERSDGRLLDVAGGCR